MTIQVARDTQFTIRESADRPWVNISDKVTGFDFSARPGDLFILELELIYDRTLIRIDTSSGYQKDGLRIPSCERITIDGVDISDFCYGYDIKARCGQVEKVVFHLYLTDEDTLRINDTAPWITKFTPTSPRTLHEELDPFDEEPPSEHSEHVHYVTDDRDFV